jgi:hypothetical protein
MISVRLNLGFTEIHTQLHMWRVTQYVPSKLHSLPSKLPKRHKVWNVVKEYSINILKIQSVPFSALYAKLLQMWQELKTF